MSSTAELSPRSGAGNSGHPRPPARRRPASDPETESNLAYWASKPRRAIEQRLDELDREWDSERAVEAAASTLALAGVLAAFAGRPRALLASALVLGVLVGRSAVPSKQELRFPGLRSRREIDRERYALRFLRGDFSAAQRGSAAGAWV